MNSGTQNNDFNFAMPLSIVKGSDGKTYFQGIASTEDEDLQEEIVKQDGIQLDYFIKNGLANDDHDKATSAIVGIPTEAKITKKGLYVKGYFLDTERAKGIIAVGKAFEKAGGDRKLAFSIEGRVLERDKKNPKIITKCWLSKVAITAQPINPNTYLEFAKSFASQDLTSVFVNEEVAKSKEKEIKEDDDELLSDLEKMSEKTKKPKNQKDEEEEDANRTALELDKSSSTEEALNPDHETEVMEKEIDDVPIAKRPRAAKSTTDESDDDSADNDDGDNESTGDEMGKGFSLVSSLGGTKDTSSKKIPVHHQVYEHKKSGHQISVSGKDGTFVVVHSNKTPSGEVENLGMQVFADVPEKGKKANDDVLEYLNGFGINHKIADKKGIKKSVETVEKALTTGYEFAGTDQTNGAALRTESLEGVDKDLNSRLNDITKVEDVVTSNGTANGGTQEVTLSDALNFLRNRGFSQDTADRILILMIRSGGDLTALKNKVV